MLGRNKQNKAYKSCFSCAFVEIGALKGVITTSIIQNLRGPSGNRNVYLNLDPLSLPVHKK